MYWKSRSAVLLAALGVTGAAAGVAGNMFWPSTTTTFHACAGADGTVQPTTIKANAEPVCKKGSRVVSWNNEGPMGPAGPQGPVGDTGAAGAGLRFWRDAEGKVVGRAIAPGVTEVGSDGVLTNLSLSSMRDEHGLPTSAVTFEHQGFSSELTARYFSNVDCTGQSYFYSGGTPGYSQNVAVDKYGRDAGWHLAGQVDLLVLSEAVQPVSVACRSDANGNTALSPPVTLPLRTLVAVRNLNSLHPAPITLE